MKLTKENIYINLQGKSKEELTELWEFLNSIGEKLFRDNIEWFLQYSNIEGDYSHLSYRFDYDNWGNLKTHNKQEVTIQQLKEILQPMEEFTPIAMKCNQEQFDAVKPKLTNCKIGYISDFDYSPYLVNNTNNETLKVCNLDERKNLNNRKVYEEWNEEIFLKACGIEVDILETMENKEFDLKGYSVEVDNEDQAKQLQEYAFKQGFKWHDCETLCYLDRKFFNFNAFNENLIHWDDTHFKCGYVTKEIHFNDIFKTEPTLTERLEKAEAEVKRLKEAIEYSKIKIGDWVVSSLNDCVFRYQYGRLEDDLTKIQDKELINKLNELIK